jgi:acyl carrier protein
MAREGVVQTVTEYILEQFLLGENPEALKETTPLILGGILNSIDTLKLVSFLEEHYAIEFKAHEINADYLNDIAAITSLVERKLTER